MIRTCPMCGEQFETDNKRREFCSITCQVKSNNIKLMERYKVLKANGVCVYCGKAKAVPGKVACKECADSRYMANRKARQKLKGQVI